MAPTATNRCSSWVFVDFMPNSDIAVAIGEFLLEQQIQISQLQPDSNVEQPSGEVDKSGEVILNKPIQIPQQQPDASVELLLCSSPSTYDNQLCFDSGEATENENFLLDLASKDVGQLSVVDNDYLDRIFNDPWIDNSIRYFDNWHSDPSGLECNTAQQCSGVTPERRLRQALNKYKEVNSAKLPHVIVAQLWALRPTENGCVLEQPVQYAFGPLADNDQMKKMVFQRYVDESLSKEFPIYLQSSYVEDAPLLSNLEVGSIILINRWVAYKAFQLKSFQWAPNIHIYSGNHIILGTLAMPVFDQCERDKFVGVFELLIDRPYMDYAAEVEEICKLLEKEQLRAETKLVYQPRQKVLLEIMNFLRDACQIHKLPLAQTWLPCKCYGDDENSQTLKICMCSAEIPFIVMDSSLFEFWKDSSTYHMCEGQGVAGRAFQSKGSCFCNDISQFSEEIVPLVHTSRKFLLRCSLAICLKSLYTGDDIYILQFFIRDSFTTMKEGKDFVDSIVQSVIQNFGSLKLASFELEEIDAKFGKITKQKWVSNICKVEEPSNVVSPSETCEVGHLIDDIVDDGEVPMVELNTNNDVEFKKGRKKKTDEAVSCKEDLIPLLIHTTQEAAKKLGVCKSTIKRLPGRFGYANWSEARKANGVTPTKRRRKAPKLEAIDSDDPSQSSDILKNMDSGLRHIA